MLDDLRRDLASFAPDRVRTDASKTIDRFLRYRVPPERILASKTDPSLLWAEKLLRILETPGGEEELADEAVRHGFEFFRAAEGLLLIPKLLPLRLDEVEGVLLTRTHKERENYAMRGLRATGFVAGE